jgi:hypothetical protein
MAETPLHLAQRLRADGEKTIQFFHAMAPQDWETVVYGEGAAWQVRQVLAHFVSAEAANRQVVADIQLGGGGAPVDFQIDPFNAAEVERLHQATSAELLEAFAGLRERTAALVEALDETDLAKTGRHPFFGAAPLEEIIKLIYRHTQIHLRDIRRSLTQTGNG